MGKGPDPYERGVADRQAGFKNFPYGTGNKRAEQWLEGWHAEDARLSAALTQFPRIEVNSGRLGGWPTVRGTRVPYDTIANLVADGSIPHDAVAEYYPSISAEDVADAVGFANALKVQR